MHSVRRCGFNFLIRQSSTRTCFTGKTPHQILGVPFGADEKTIKEAYRSLAVKWHPDTNPAPEATETLQKINQARDALLLRGANSIPEEASCDATDMYAWLREQQMQDRKKEYAFFHSDALDEAIYKNDVNAVKECM